MGEVSEKVSATEIQSALDRVLASPAFEHGGRIAEFLSYVIAEEIAGRGDAIRGKTIAQDVYGRAPQEAGDTENVVRVDARRLRQHLEQYYQSAGTQDPFRIHLDSGGYRPRVAAQAMDVETGPNRSTSQISIYAGLFTLGTAVGVGLMMVLGPSSDPPVSNTAMSVAQVPVATVAERTAILQKSHATLEAITLADQAYRMIYPIFDRERQALLTLIFERVVALDPDYFGGYAGLARTLSIRSMLSLDLEARTELIASAQEASAKAVRLAPTEPRTQSALAFVRLAEKDGPEALRLSELAVDLAPDNEEIADVLGTVALFSGAYEKAVMAANEGSARSDRSQRFANRNIFAAASYHLGNYKDAYETFREAAALGDPLSPPTLAYQAAALSAAGRKNDAHKKLDELNRAWPNAPLDAMLYGIHTEASNADAVLDELKLMGWTPQ